MESRIRIRNKLPISDDFPFTALLTVNHRAYMTTRSYRHFEVVVLFLPFPLCLHENGFHSQLLLPDSFLNFFLQILNIEHAVFPGYIGDFSNNLDILSVERLI